MKSEKLKQEKQCDITGIMCCFIKGCKEPIKYEMYRVNTHIFMFSCNNHIKKAIRKNESWEVTRIK